MISLKMTIPNLAVIFKNHQNDIYMALAASMQTNRAMMFDKDGADNGKEKWDPLKLRSGRPLQKTGALRQSMAPRLTSPNKPGAGKDSVLRVSGNAITVGTRLAYAGMMNDGTTKLAGGVLIPTQAKALKIPLENGGFMFRKSVKIPARPMNTVTSEDKAEWAETLSNYIAELLSGAPSG